MNKRFVFNVARNVFALIGVYISALYAYEVLDDEVIEPVKRHRKNRGY